MSFWIGDSIFSGGVLPESLVFLVFEQTVPIALSVWFSTFGLVSAEGSFVCVMFPC